MKYDSLIRVLTRIDGLTGDARAKRHKGLDWPTDGAETMIGVERMENVKDLALDVLRRGIPGDFAECGTWRGGVGILLSHILADARDGRTVWVADSFEGCPKPSPEFPADAKDRHHKLEFLKVSLSDVQANFARYGALGEHVRFIPGWFKDTLPGPIRSLALLRLDGDLYESTWQALSALYDRVSPGGYVICDDYGNIPNCRAAIDDFLKCHPPVELKSVDWCAVYWQKPAEQGRRAA